MNLSNPAPRSHLIKNALGYHVEHGLGDRVDALTYRVANRDGPHQETLARLLLAHNPESMEALLALSEFAKTASEKLLYLKEAVRVGGHVWAPAIEEGDANWWNDVGTKTYMRALASYGRALLAQENCDKGIATRCFEVLLEMNPDDPLGVRADLLRAMKPADEPPTDVELADRINAFLEAHAKKNPSFDPEEDFAEDFLAGDDAKSLYNAAVALKEGREPDDVVMSVFDEDSWNGCPNAELEFQHDELVRAVNEQDFVRTSMPAPGCR